MVGTISDSSPSLLGIEGTASTCPVEALTGTFFFFFAALRTAHRSTPFPSFSQGRKCFSPAAAGCHSGCRSLFLSAHPFSLRLALIELGRSLSSKSPLPDPLFPSFGCRRGPCLLAVSGWLAFPAPPPRRSRQELGSPQCHLYNPFDEPLVSGSRIFPPFGDGRDGVVTVYDGAISLLVLRICRAAAFPPPLAPVGGHTPPRVYFWRPPPFFCTTNWIFPPSSLLLRNFRKLSRIDVPSFFSPLQPCSRFFFFWHRLFLFFPAPPSRPDSAVFFFLSLSLFYKAGVPKIVQRPPQHLG